MKLYPFQEQAVIDSMVFLNGPLKAVYNASEMGLGKSLMALSCARKLKAKSILIVCPASVTFVWKDELEKWFSDASQNLQVVIVSYNKLLNKERLKEITKQKWDLFIGDEIHYCKSPKAQRTKIIRKEIWPICDKKICLSGTPLSQSVADGWAVWSLIYPAFGGYWDFCKNFTKIQSTPWGQKPTSIINEKELSSTIRQNFFIRYLKEDVLTELPEKTWVKIPLESKYAVKLSDEDEVAQKKYIEALKRSFATGESIPAVPPKALATWRMEQGVKKIPAVLEFCKDILDQDIPLVVFTYHKEVLKQLREGLASYDPCVIEGATSQTDRGLAVHRFQGGASNLFLGQLTAANAGITLTRSSTVVFAELDWSPTVIKQAADRCHRIGTIYPVTLYFFSVEGSIDEDIAKALIDKQRTFDKALGEEKLYS